MTKCEGCGKNAGALLHRLCSECWHAAGPGGRAAAISRSVKENPGAWQVQKPPKKTKLKRERGQFLKPDPFFDPKPKP